MRLLKLKLRGAIGIKKGLGLDEVEIDFTNFQPGLIALIGRNGSGKTTIMENLHPHRQMVSRDGSIQSHFFLKDSWRILEFEHIGEFYKSQILIDALTGGSEAYLFKCDLHINDLRTDDISWRPLNDGKLTTYDKEIEKLLGTPELFFNSVFSGQKSKGIAALKPADRRKLFYELLNLDSYEGYLEKTKQKLKAKEIELAEIEGSIKAINEVKFDLTAAYESNDSLIAQLKSIEESLSNISADISVCEKDVQDKTLEIRSAEEKLKSNVETKEKIESLEGEIEQITTAHNSKVLRIQSDITDAEKLCERAKKLTEQKGFYNGKIKEKEILQNDLSEHRKNKSNYQTEFNNLETLHSKEVEKIQNDELALSEDVLKKNTIENEIASLEKEIERSENGSGIIDEVPCGNKESIISKYDFPGCQFLKDAYIGKNGLPALRSTLSEKKELLITLNENIDKKRDSINTAKQMESEKYTLKSEDFKKKINSIDTAIEKAEELLAELNKTDHTKLLTEANEAESTIKLQTEKVSSLNGQLQDSKDSFNQQIERIKKDITDLNSKIDSALEEKITEMRALLNSHQDQLEDLKAALKEKQEESQSNITERTKLAQQIDQAEQSAIKLTELSERKANAESEIKDWNFLCKAFDKTGIPVLKLENSGIEITSIANELLSLFENKFRIAFETTSLTKDKKKMKETFDINIIEEDGVCEISNKSGGQQVWLETAIQLAIMILLSSQGKKVETAFLDEKDGALDLDNAYAYIEMLKKAHQMSGVYNTFVITHRTELLDFIPQQVKLNNGILEIINN